MSGFKSKFKQKAGRLFDKVRPGSRASSPTPPETDVDTDAPKAPTSSIHNYANPQSALKVVGTAGSVIYELLATARDGSDMCLPLKVALVGVVKIWDVCERTSQVKIEFEKLESRLTHLHSVAEAYGKKNDLDVNLKQRLDNIADSFARLATCVESKLGRGTTRRVLESKTDIDEVKDILLKISARIEAFLYESMIRVEIGVHAILSRLPTAEERVLQKELEAWSAITQIIASALGGRRVHEAAHDAQPKDAGCMPGTRIGVLSKFVEWVKHDPKGILWLAGLVGTGKTSVAISLCHMLEKDPDVLLGGAFFCSRTTNVEAQTDVRRILPTLSASLADRSPKFATDLAAELKPHAGAAANKPVSDQIGPLLQRPISALVAETRPIVFVIDALDECSNERELAELLAAIVKFKSSANVKFILTSRPETHILDTPIADCRQNEILQLHLIEAAEVTQDIRLYIEDAFSKKPLATPWYSDTDVTTLATLSNGLFIFVSTMIHYILDSKSVHNRTTRLQTVLAAVGQSAVAMGPLDAMYEFVLTRASNSAKVEPEELEVTRRVLACILTARVPLSANMLADIMDMQVDHLRDSLQRLLAVVHVPNENDGPGLRTFHASFGDYLFRRAPQNIRITASFGHDLLACGCLKRMAWNDFCFNVSRSRSSNNENDPTSAELISPSLVYACLQWAPHAAAASEASILDALIHDIFLPKFLFWLEVLSVLRKVGAASGLLRIAGSAVANEFLSRFLLDANSFVASSREAIERSAPHIYLSALPLAAKDELVYQRFASQCTGLVSVETSGIERHDSRLVTVLIGHTEWVLGLAYSSDGRQLASSSLDGTIRIWDMHTADETVILRSDGTAVHSVAMSPNGKSIASGTNGGVYIWTNLAGQPTVIHLRGHSKSVISVGFSRDGSVLASGSDDKTIRLWTAQTGQLIAVLSGHDGEVNSIAFSPCSQILASGSSDATIRLWDYRTSEPVGLPLVGHKTYVFSVGFSPDGTMLASGSADRTIIIWECQTWDIVRILRGHVGWVRSVQFSSNGQSLVSASDDKSIRLWPLQQAAGEIISTVLAGHSNQVSAAECSPEGLHVASASRDNNIRIWNAANCTSAVYPLPAHDNAVFSVAISPDGSLIVSGSYDHSVRVWYVRNGEPKLPPLLGHTEAVLSVAISTDGLLIASASMDRTIKLWDARSGQAIGEPLKGHEAAVSSVIFSPDDRLLASGSWDKTVKLWNTTTGQSPGIGPFSYRDEVGSVAFSPDGSLLAAGDNSGLILLWQTATGQQIFQSLQAVHCVESVSFSPTGMHLVSVGFTITNVWEITTGRQVIALDNEAYLYGAAFSPDGRFICTGSSEPAVQVWEASTGSLAATLRGHGSAVRSVAFTPNGESIVSGAVDGTIRIWDVKTACSPSSDNENDLIAALTSTSLEDGWMLGTAGELLFWVPEEYRAYLHAPPRTLVIGPCRIVITAAPSGLHRGEGWANCWAQHLSP